MRMAMRIGVRLAAVALLGLAGLGRPALAEGERGEARLEALERRVDRLERKLKEKDAEIERLRERLERRDAAPEARPFPRPPGRPGEWPFGPGRQQFDDLHERTRREIERWGLEWGLPGRERRPDLRPRELTPRALPGRAFLGIEMEDAQGEGVAIRRVVPGSPAAQAGLAPGDELLVIDGHPVVTPTEVVAIVGAHQPGDEIELRLRRAGRTLTVKAKLAPRAAEELLPMPQWRLGPARPLAPGRRGRDQEKGPDKAKPGDSIEVEVAVPGGRASVSLSAPGLYLSGELAAGLDLTEAERRRVEDAFARAAVKLRDGLARELSEALARGEGKLDAGAVREKRLEAERAARQMLAGKLPEEKLEALERAQARVALRSGVSISITRGSQERRTRRERGPEAIPFEDAQEF